MIYSYVFIFSNPCNEADPQIIIIIIILKHRVNPYEIDIILSKNAF